MSDKHEREKQEAVEVRADRQNARLTIGLLLPATADAYNIAIQSGLIKAAQEHDANLIIFVGGQLHHSPYDQFTDQNNAAFDLASHVDGLVIHSAVGNFVTFEELTEFYAHYRPRPTICLNKTIPGVVNVIVDNKIGMRELIVHLIEKHGYQRIAFNRGPENNDDAEERYHIYTEVLAEHGLSLDPNLVAPGDFLDTSGAEAIHLLLDERKVNPQALVSANDNMAIGALRALQARGARVPADVAVAGFDDIEDAKAILPSLTTIRQPLFEQGKQAAETVLAQLAGEQVPEKLILPTTLVVRQSCGCVDPAVDQAKAGTIKQSSKAKALRAGLASQRAHILAETTKVVEGLRGNLLAGSGEQLWDAFTSELDKHLSGFFLLALDEVLRQIVAADGDVSIMQGVISVMRRHALPYLSGELLTQAEDLWQQARVVIGLTAQQQQMSASLLTERQNTILREIESALLTTFDMNGLIEVLTDGLPRLGIPNYYLALYENPQPYKYPNPVPEWSRLILAYTEKNLVKLEPGGLRFQSRELVPESVRPQGKPFNFVLEPLYFQKNQFGYVVFEAITQNSRIYEGLRTQISSMLQSAMLMQRLEHRAVQLETAAQVSRATSSVLDLKGLIQEAVDLVRDRFNLYYVGLFLVDEARHYAVLQAGTDEAGRQMLERGHRLEATGDSMIGWCIANQKARIALNIGDEAMRFNNPLLTATQSEVALPLISRGQAIGAMTVQSDRVAAFTQEDVTVLQTMADQLANAISNARLFEQTQQRTAELSSAREVAEAARHEAEKARQEAEAEKEIAEAAKEEAEAARLGSEEANRNLAAQMWQTTGQALLNDRVRGEQDISTLANNVIDQLCQYIGAQVGTLYLVDTDLLKLAGTYAYRRKNLTNEFQLGEGAVGQAALKNRLSITELPNQYVTSIFSSTGELLPQYILVAPFAYEGQTIGVVEIESLTEFTAAQLEFLDKALESVAVGFTTAQARQRVNELLAKTQQQAGELQMQEEELRSANEELASQADSLRASEAKLRTNQAELESVNVELEEKASVLQEQRQVLDRQNQELRLAQRELKQKADDLAVASKYKSEFLANMSHELRTPLNSLLILAGMLAKNSQGNLTDDQVESVQIIYSGGVDLLNLINDILDLSKVEAGRMEFRYAALPLTRLMESMRAQFGPTAEGKGLEFVIQSADDLPETIETDQQRVEQIIKNLLSNAFKFTQQGSVNLDIYRPTLETDLSKSGLKSDQAIAIRVSDTGIGMTPDQQKIVFEAFQQADGSTSRQYGGTGLGLSISRELSMKLGGQIDLASEMGKGSQFTLYLPIERREVAMDPIGIPTTVSSQTKPLTTSDRTISQADDPLPATGRQPDDRAAIRAGDRVLLIIEDDPAFAEVVQDYGRNKNFKCLIANDGETGLRLAQRYKPDAIVLDLNLPDISGWEVLDELKHNPDLLHIPVHIITGQDESLDAFKRGAMGFLTKPIGLDQLDGAFQSIEQFMARKIKSLLVVEDDDNLRKSVRKLLEGSDVTISEASSGQAALALLEAQPFDCMILDLTLPDMSGFELLNRLHAAEHLAKCPVIVYTGKALSEEENQELMKYADSVIVKGAKSPERLLDEAALFLHRVVADMPEENQRMIKKLLGNEGVLAGKEILIVDDDTRNAFAMSKLLADRGLKVHIAPNGEKALETLSKGSIDLVLMDVMLPGMDGYEITRRIRAQLKFRQLPILALTAKAMKGDREKCLEAGANDYLSKPVDAERLLSMLRVWLSKE